MQTTTQRGPRPAHVGPAPPQVVRATPPLSVACGVGVGTASLEAARQAGLFARHGRVTLVAIGESGRTGPDRAALAAAFVLSGRGREAPKMVEVLAPAPLPMLLVLAGHHDLLVVGAHDESGGRADTTAATVRQSPVPVLVARSPGTGSEVTDRILIAARDTRAVDAASVASELGIVERGASVTRLTMSDSANPTTARRLHGSSAARSCAALRDAAAAQVLCAARDIDATLVVIESRGLTGIAAFASVSAAVAARADCSVLVLRGS